MQRNDLIQEIDKTWNELQSFIKSLSEQQLTGPADAAGWTVKDHLIHVAMWEKASLAMLNGKSKRETLDISVEVWEQDDDPINAVLQERYHDMPLDEVLQSLSKHHDDMMKKIKSFSDDDLQLPYKHYQPQSDSDRQIMDYIHWDTVHHYGEHIEWMKAIVA